MTTITGEKITSRCYFYVVKYNGTKKAFCKSSEAIEYYNEYGKQLIAQEKDELFPKEWVILERSISDVPVYKNRIAMIK